jgi:hypothetical protein
VGIMPSLPEVLLSDAKKSAVIDDCVALIDAEVADKGGLSGLAIKAGYGAVKGIKPGFIKQAVTDMLPDFAKALDGVYQDATSQNKAIGSFFASNAARVADSLLTITDARAQQVKSGVVKATYDKLRNTAKKNVEAAVPRLGKMVEKHAAG